jgi:hypothetical protein
MLTAKLARLYPARIVKTSLLVQCQISQVGQVLETSMIAHVKNLRSIISLGLRSVLSCCKSTALYSSLENRKLKRGIARNYYRKSKSCFGNGGMETRPLRNRCVARVIL